MNREEKAEIILYNWLRPKVKEIYSNRKHKYLSTPVFKVSGDKDKKIPDFIIQTKDDKYIIVEVKPSDENYLVTSGGSQMYQRYYLPYCLGDKNFLIDGKEIIIHSFIIATDESINSKLFRDREYLEDNTSDPKNIHKINCVNKWRNLPRYEYSTTYQFVRNLWKSLNEDLQRIKPHMKRYAGIGILMADYESKEPYIFVKYKTKTFGQHYWRIE